jgi:glycyl-tRNA synthetase
VGTPICITVDYDSLEGERSVTVRDRDTRAQQRVSLDRLEEFVRDYYRAG